MTITGRIEELVVNIKQDQTTQKFQQQYIEMIELGVIERKGYNLADVNVLGDSFTSNVNCNFMSGIPTRSINQS